MICRKFLTLVGLPIFILSPAYAAETNNAAGLETTNAVSAWVPGNANLWLAGMPDGSIAGNKFDVAPDQSPIEVKHIPIQPDEILTFSAAGGVANGPFQLAGADGIDTYIVSRVPGAENGISDITAPIDGLIGVFLDDSAPSNFAPSTGLDFSTASNRDFATLYPQLRQPFFIGDGKDAAGGVQQFVAPAGATRLFLGTMDSYEWADNRGSFTVQVSIVPKSP
ncbi:MAG TPA: PEP-CTERM sorting domain-containing protein [Verrucomicrobiae bacterium]|jgi:hypothetical protein|nr:PEP-CTERM sorting domain-containing protein [Verrucomicrobiae bacterium]